LKLFSAGTRHFTNACTSTFLKEENMDHHEAVRKFEHLMLKAADQSREVATELEVLVTHLPNEKSRELAHLQIKASHNQAKEFRELAQKVKED
jgi:3-oxoacyl-[acyl-carrier-protein] synthase III